MKTGPKDMASTRRARKATTELPHGAYTFIARELVPPVSAQHVREVFKGNRTSPRVERAIRAYQRGMDVARQSA